MSKVNELQREVNVLEQSLKSWERLAFWRGRSLGEVGMGERRGDKDLLATDINNCVENTIVQALVNGAGDMIRQLGKRRLQQQLREANHQLLVAKIEKDAGTWVSVESPEDVPEKAESRPPKMSFVSTSVQTGKGWVERMFEELHQEALKKKEELRRAVEKHELQPPLEPTIQLKRTADLTEKKEAMLRAMAAYEKALLDVETTK